MPTLQKLEQELREIITNELMVSHVEFAEPEDELALDSLTQTELRVTLQQRYGIDPSPEAMPVSVTENLATLVNHIHSQIKH